ncbi:MAG: aminotransferase class IV, partial [Rhodospirillaceae bacterium]
RNQLSPLAGIKSTNVLDSILAREEAAAAGADDALLLNTEGNVAEASAANVFALIDGGLVTPPVSDGALPGIMRGEVIRLARGEERTITVESLERASEIFLSNALGLRPVVSINGKPVGDGEVGLITQLLAARL